MENELKIGERLSELMIEHELDNKTLADKVGVSAATVGRWRRSVKYMYLSQILKLANYFNCSLDFLTGRSETVIDFVPQDCPPFYSRLKNILEAKGISRNKINRETKIKSSHFVDWNKGTDPHILSLVELADYLEITLDYLVGREK